MSAPEKIKPNQIRPNLIRVVQWATGTTGRLALRAVIEDPDLEIVGVRVYDPEKVGQDAGTLAGTEPTGVSATDDRDAILALDPDVVLYMGSVEKYRDQCVADVIDLLASGIDVVATGSSFVDIRAFDADTGRAIDAACLEGSSTFLGLGLFPGFWGEAIAPLLSRLAFRCDRIVVREAMSYAGYPSTEMMFDVMGYGQPPESDDAVLGDITRAGYAFVSTAAIIAKALGLEIRTIEPFREVAVTDTELHVAAGVVPPPHRRCDEAGAPGRLRCGRDPRRARHLDGARREARVVGARGLRDRVRRRTDVAVQSRPGHPGREPHRDGMPGDGDARGARHPGRARGAVRHHRPGRHRWFRRRFRRQLRRKRLT
jgi:hypothetical protein